MRRCGIGFWAVLLVSGAVAQAQSFDVASVKPHPQSADGMIRVRMNGGPGTPDPVRLNYENVSLKAVLGKAFDVKSYQLTTPDWADSERYDITAKIPQGTTKEQFGVMLQNLLVERFKLAYHRDKKELPAYILVAGKAGSKMKVSEGPAAGGTSMRMQPGKATMNAAGVSMTQLVDMLANQVDRPIVDGTGLTGRYDFTLEFAPEMRNMPGMPMMAGGGPVNEGESAPSLFTAVQEQLGLRLEPKKAMLDLIVVDRLEKTPTEN
jgi:uncharacterized protein (TIGR03435 family)